MSKLIDILMPQDQQGTESVVERWLRHPGDRVRVHEPLLEINTDKAVVEVAAPAAGILREALRTQGAAVQPGEVLGRIEAEEQAAAVQPSAAPLVPVRSGVAEQRAQLLSPAVRQLLKQHNLDVAQIKGTGRSGRVTHEDVQNFLKGQAALPASLPLPSGSRRVPHSPMRRRIAQHMVESLLKTAPHVTAVFDADLSALVAHRAANKSAFEQQGVHLTYTAYFVAAAVQALQAVPEVNSRWHEDALELFADCHIGVAAAVPGGLLVPVVHSAQRLDLLGIASTLQDLTGRARTGKLLPADLQGGTFTITNHGVSGSLLATPVINQPQSAILGIGKVEKRLVVREQGGHDSMQIRPMAYVTLTIDHRALDGFQANAFLAKFVEALTSW